VISKKKSFGLGQYSLALGEREGYHTLLSFRKKEPINKSKKMGKERQRDFDAQMSQREAGQQIGGGPTITKGEGTRGGGGGAGGVTFHREQSISSTPKRRGGGYLTDREKGFLQS